MAMWVMLVLVPWLALIWLVVALLRAGGGSGGAVVVPDGLAGMVAELRRGANRRVLVSGVVGGAVGMGMLLVALAAEWGVQAVAVASIATAGAACLAAGLVGPPAGTAPLVRSAELTPRSWRGFGPRWAFPIPATLAILLVVLLVGAAMVATSAPDGGPALAWSSTDDASGYVEPWPGWPTVLPLLAGLALAGGCYLLGLHRIAGWPRPTEAALFGLDDDVRRSGTRMLLFTASGALLAALGSITLVTTRAWDTAATTIRTARDTAPPLLDTAAGTASTTLEKALDLASIAAGASVLAGITVMLSALAAGWVRSPRTAAQPVPQR